MRFEIKHRFDAPLERVEAAMFDEEIVDFLVENMATIVRVEPIERKDEGSTIRRRIRYIPVPMIKRVGTKKVPPEWMAWVEESSYDTSTHQMQFRNVPVIGRIAQLLENSGTITLRAADGKTERIVAGELRVKVPLLGRIAEKIIYGNAEKILDDEAQAMTKYLAP